MRIVGQNSDVHFGEVDEEEPDWRNELEEETDPDDEELEYTPQDVIDILGFDPKEFSEPTSNESDPMSLNTTKDLLIINAKKSSGVKNPKMKGWTDAARKKAAMTRKAKKIAGKSGETAPKIKVAPAPTRRPDYQKADTTLPGLKAALKSVGADTKGSKMDLVSRLADTYHSDPSKFDKNPHSEAAYVSYYAEQRRFYDLSGNPVKK